MRSSEVVISTNPAIGKEIGAVRVSSREEVREAVARARQAGMEWGCLTVRDRVRALGALNTTIVNSADEIASLLTAEQGKNQVEAYGEVFSVLDQLRYYRKVAPRLLRPRRVWPLTGLTRVHRVLHQPFGVVGVISPWNFPFTLSMEPVLAALVAGNGVVLKPSEYSTLIGQKMAELFRIADLPDGLVQVVIGAASTGEALIGSGIDRLVFTGSVETGRKVAALAGAHLVPVTLELGGKDAAIVLEDADLERAVGGITWGANINAGQACLAIERVYVVETLADEFITRVTEAFQRLRVGPGSDVDTDIAAITTPQQLETIAAHVNDAMTKGATLLCGGKPLKGGGRFFEPTVLTDVTDDMRVMQEETFGPLIAIQRVRDADEALQRVNSSGYGLTASIWTRDERRGRRLAERLEVGDVAINDHGASAGYPEIPWGGVKDSGYGRTRGPEGLLGMVVLKHVSWPRFHTRREAHWFPYSSSSVNLVRRGIQLLFGPWRAKLAALFGVG